ncbi:RNA polymerase I-specific transcription initiation factor RRN3, partial [Phlegmacium glaucopus]
MDPHSRLSQFNHRVTKAGPQSRNIELIPSPKDSFKMPSRKSSTSTKADIHRPIATNSRVKQDEMFKRDMYLSFVSNSLQQKTNGSSDSFDKLVGQFTTFSSNPKSSRTSNAQSSQQVDMAQIRLWILALSHVVSRLERTHASLVHAIVDMPWTTLDNATVKSYTVFIGMLLSARPEYLSLVLAKIAQGFTYQSCLQALDTSLPESSTAPVTRRLIYDRLHYLLRHILSLIPTLPSTLQAFLIRHFPHKRQNQVAQTTYIRNLLKVSSYCPELEDKILATIVDRAIQMDVEIQIELEELEEDESVEDHDIFELDPFDVIVGQEGDSLSDDEDSDEDDDDGDNFSDLSSDAGDMDGDGVHVEVPTNIKHIQDMVKKLDAILTLLFQHFQRTYEAFSASNSSVSFGSPSPLELLPLPPLSPATPSLSVPPMPFMSFDTSSTPLAAPVVISMPTPQSQQTTKAPIPHTEQYFRVQFQSLLSIFDRIILRTFKSRYTQFLIFWYTSLDPEFADIFQGMLVDRALLGADPQRYGESTTTEDEHSAMANAHMITPELTRAAAASYIGSFVSRATFVDREGVRRVVGVLCEFLNARLECVEQVLRAGQATSGAAGAFSAQGQHTVFYAVAQAVFLIFCFRWRDLVDDDMGDDDDEPRLYLDSSGMIGRRIRKPINSSKDKWMPELGVLKRVVVSVLNPLKVCSTNVVMQFARVAHATDFIYCYTILETNKRAEHGRSGTAHVSPPHHRQSGASTTITMTTKINPSMFVLPVHAELNTFFPFDPYRLPKSNAFIQAVYREWSSVAIEDEDEDDEEDPDREERGESDDGTSSRYLDIPRENDVGLGESLGAMSISPL